MAVLQSINLAIRFLLEICALVAVGYWGFNTGGGVSKVLLGVGAPIVLVVVWGVFGSPNAVIKLSTVPHLLLEKLWYLFYLLLHYLPLENHNWHGSTESV